MINGLGEGLQSLSHDGLATSDRDILIAIGFEPISSGLRTRTQAATSWPALA